MKWWQKAVVYQIYPRSFQDSNGDGIGDLPGIISRLDYLAKLGIGAIWLSPVYQSPNVDNGYDISDYQAIAEEYGSMEDMDLLIKEARKRQIRIVMDLVVNHTSDQHPWFIEAKRSKTNPYHDFYVWSDQANDLGSTFGGSAWEYDEHLKQYYLHLFTKQQPDLNWANENLRKAIYQMMNFWIAKGIGGFRMDVIDLIGKQPAQKITANGPKLHTYLQEMNQATFGNSDLMTVGETWGASPKEAKLYSDPKRQELAMVFQFEHMTLDQGQSKWDVKSLDVAKLKQVLSKWQQELSQTGWNSLFWNNHDLPRIVSRWGDEGQYRLKSAKLFAILLHLMKGTPYIYQGEEIGMTNRKVISIDQVDDIESRNAYQELLAQGLSQKEALAAINKVGRDNARTPMQWDASPNAGFSQGQPWLAVNPNYQTINVAQALADPNSIFYTYQKLIELRNNNPLVVLGDYQLLKTSPEVFAYYRTYQEQKWLMVANLSHKENSIEITDEISQVILDNGAKPLVKGHNLLEPYDALVVKLA